MRLLRRLALLSLAGAAVVCSSAPCIAGDKTPLSSLKTMPVLKDRAEPEKLGVPGLTVKENRPGPSAILALAAAKDQGYCLVSRDDLPSLQAEGIWSANDATDQFDLWHLVEKDDTATLEQARLKIVPSRANAWALNKSAVELHAVARTNGVTVWGFRNAQGDAVLLARGFSSGRVLGMNPETVGMGFVSSDCSFGAVRLLASLAKAGSYTQIRGSLPPVGEGKSKTIPQFVVNGSIAKLSRDPEPLLDVRIRLVE